MPPPPPPQVPVYPTDRSKDDRRSPGRNVLVGLALAATTNAVCFGSGAQSADDAGHDVVEHAASAALCGYRSRANGSRT
jgi:hypothetical protein